MGFALWREGPLVYCEGTHEYRPMGGAVTHGEGQFSARDFRPLRQARPRGAQGFEGYFASLGAVNDYLRRAKRERRNSHRILGTL
ncbi:MAG: hypothetical protein OHK0021_14930 [Bryobacter sp.]